MPWKSSIYALLFACMNQSSSNLGVELMSIPGDAMNEALKVHNWKVVKLVVRICDIVELQSEESNSVVC